MENMEDVKRLEKLNEIMPLTGMIEATTNVDMVFVIDATESMTPVINTVKEFALRLYDDVIEGLKEYSRTVNQFRVKVIVFRDYYCDGDFAMEESEFFYLPDESPEFKEFVSEIEAKGGGDEPESALEALALAMRSDWVKEGISKRHTIILFTDASAHPFEKAKNVEIENYPEDMFCSYEEMLEAWNSAEQGTCLDKENCFKMSKNARRLILFAPDAEPWTELAVDFEQCFMTQIESNEGCGELDKEMIINTIAKSMR